MSSDRPLTSYDVVPYASTAFPQSHPDRLATLARLFGVAAAPPGRCRVLELGAASGGNLIPMAYELPESRFVGIDLSGRQVADGESAIRELGLANIELRQLSIAEIGADFGLFDYIICHGVYSWVPDAVRESILAVCRSHLASNGVAFVSYNTYPGWHMRSMIRDMMRYHAGRFTEPQAQIEQARSLLNFLATSVAADTPYGVMLRQELEGLQKQPDSYLFHEHLEEVNSPMYFFEFAQQLERHGLQYLGEADFPTMLASSFSAKVVEVLKRVASDIFHMEQYMDFLRNRTFRQTLLVRRERVLRRNLTPDDVKPFFITSAAKPVTTARDLGDSATEQFRVPDGRVLTTSNPVTRAAMAVLAQCWPQAIPFRELCDEVVRLLEASAIPDSLPRDTAVEFLAGELLSAYTAGIVELRPRELRCTAQPGDRPVASRLARWLARKDPNVRVVNLRHEPVALPPLERQVLQWLDGDQDRRELQDKLSHLVRTGVLNVEQNGAKVSVPALLDPLLRKLIEQGLSTLTASALMER